jgi:hypothetical protein
MGSPEPQAVIHGLGGWVDEPHSYALHTLGLPRTMNDIAILTVAGSGNEFNMRALRFCDLSIGDGDILVSDLAQILPVPLHARIESAAFEINTATASLNGAKSGCDAERESSGGVRAHTTSRWKLLFSQQFPSSVSPVNGVNFT